MHQWRFAIISLGHPTYLQDYDVLSYHFDKVKNLSISLSIVVDWKMGLGPSKKFWPCNIGLCRNKFWKNKTESIKKCPVTRNRIITCYKHWYCQAQLCTFFLCIAKLILGINKETPYFIFFRKFNSKNLTVLLLSFKIYFILYSKNILLNNK